MLFLIRDLEKLPLDQVKARIKIFINKMNATSKKQDYLDTVDKLTDKTRLISFAWNLVLSGNNLEVIDGATYKQKEKKRKKELKRDNGSVADKFRK